ncbi:diguanylate cyclase domain-containing protein [Shewanella cyperi]|uniref:Diguanylate cyclase n=1 Tax=Shewanella cyperi TaxID=2814292 RepID=A0A975AMA5_9GAMM|nr:diguanylate cyclase [Shewanella cyperi]QSX31262.1 diguanylate cyclase [Shewanella cyperi]QSX42047.1 diguanylate cyclase [Shewanella cyperi]
MIYSFRNSGFRDPETGVYNQTYFMEVFHREWHRHLRENQSLALLYLCPNIHESSDQPHLLELFTNEIQNTLKRATDLIARLDKEHFALGLFNIDAEGTAIVAKRIEEQISEFKSKYGKDKSLMHNYKLIACICHPSKEHKIETLFNSTEALCKKIESDPHQHIVLERLQ